MKSKMHLDKRNALIYAGIFLLSGVICFVMQVMNVTLAELYEPTFVSAGIPWTVVSLAIVLPLMTLLAYKFERTKHLWVIVLNIAAFFAFLFFIGSYTPFVLIWIIVMMISYWYSGIVAFIASSLLLVLETAVTLILYKNIVKEMDTYILFSILSIVVVVGTIIGAYLLVKMFARAKDRTERLTKSQQAEEVQLNRLDTLLNSISDTVLTLNRYGRITSQNAAALSFFDTNESLVGKSIDTVLHIVDDKSQEVSVRTISRDIRGTLIRDDVSLKDSSDSVMRLSLQLSPIHGKFGDDDNGCVVIIRDITRQKTLEDEKDEFISVTSHELRTPIAIAEGSLSNLAFMFDKGAKPEQLRKSADMAHEQILYLGRMINDLSTLSRAERGVGDAVEEIDLNALIQELFLRYQSEAEAKSLQLNLDLDKLPNISTSRLYLEEILQNFITNAIKYTKEGSVTLKGKYSDKKITFAVTDSGIGISKTDQEKIFDKFFRSEDYRTRETSGTGLGLYVVRKLADKLNTKVEVESRLNHGSTFSFSLPVRQVASPVVAESEKAS